jgi:acetyl-CoA carboxylase carboxyltransferase component
MRGSVALFAGTLLSPQRFDKMASQPDGLCPRACLFSTDESIIPMPFSPHSAGSESLAALVEQFREAEAEITLGGGRAAIERQHAKHRLTARERIERLLDPGTQLFELGLWAGWQMYDVYGGAPAAGVVTGIGTVAGRRHVIIANDATVKAGAFFPATAKKVLRAQRIAMQNRLPLIYLVDSAGVFLPLQEDVFPDEDDFGRIFRNNAIISARGIPQFAAIMGNCVAGGGYLPVLCDTLLMTEGSGLYLAGPALVKAAIGQTVSHEDLGGAAMHAAVSGTIDFREKDDPACLDRLRRLVATLPADVRRVDASIPAAQPASELFRFLSGGQRQEFDIRELIACLVDGGPFDEYKAEYGQTIVCGYARLGGLAIGVVANQRKRCKPAEGPLQYGGVIYVDSAD